MAQPFSHGVVATDFGACHVHGLHRLEIDGDLATEAAAAVAAPHARQGMAPRAVIWDDPVPRLARMVLPMGDPLLTATFDGAARFAAFDAAMMAGGGAGSGQPRRCRVARGLRHVPRSAAGQTATTAARSSICRKPLP